jgi:hypothetical protein
MNAPTPFDVVQRWRARRDLYRPAGEPIDAHAYGVDVIEERAARAFVVGHHYSASYPAAVCRVGLFRADAGLVGVAVFSVPCNPATVPARLGVGAEAGVELGRFVLLDDVPANGETWFLRRAFAVLRAEKPAVRAVLAYSDPEPRTTLDGDVVMPGHVGTIYQAHNARYLGRARRERVWLTGDGRTLNRRTLSKLRRDEGGAAGAYAQMLAAGAPPRRPLESGPAYVERALREGPFRTYMHPGVHAYAWGLDRRAERALPTAVAPTPKRGAASPPARVLNDGLVPPSNIGDPDEQQHGRELWRRNSVLAALRACGEEWPP